MITTQEAFRGLYAAWRLLLRDRSAVALLDDSAEGFWKSFSCAVIILPGYILLVAFAGGGPAEDTDPIRIVLVEGISYVIGWVAWPLLVSYITPLLDRREAYIRYIVAYNWSAGPQILILILLLVLQSSGILNQGPFAAISLVALLVLMFYHGFIVRLALDVTVELAVALVVGEFLLGQVIRMVSDAMLA